MARSVKCQPCKHGDLDLVLQNPGQKLGFTGSVQGWTLTFLALGMHRQEDFWGSLPN